MANRLYSSIWEEIKVKNICVVKVAQPSKWSRVKRGVIKEKDGDVGFKMLNFVERPRLQVDWDKDKAVLTFKLVPKFGILDIITETQ